MGGTSVEAEGTGFCALKSLVISVWEWKFDLFSVGFRIKLFLDLMQLQ